MDFSGILGAISAADSAAAVLAIVGMGAVAVVPGFGKWVVKKVATFFG